MQLVRTGATRTGACVCAMNEAVQKRLSKMFFPFNDTEIPRKLRQQAWAFRITYILWSAGQTVMVFYIPNSYLWNGDELNAHATWTLLLMLVMSWVFYFQIQGSNPGYIHAHMLHRFHTVHNTFGEGQNGEGDSFSGYIFRQMTNLGRRAVTTFTNNDDTTAAKNTLISSVAANSVDEKIDAADFEAYADSSSSGEEDTQDPSQDIRVDIVDVESKEAVQNNEQRPHFVKADVFSGPRDGYNYHQKGKKGSGYYLDVGEQQSSDIIKKSPATLHAESMARVERYLAGQDKGKATKVFVPKFNMRKYDEDTEIQSEVGNKYERSRFLSENGEIGRDDGDDGTFQSRMDFADIADDFPLRSHYCRQADRVVPKFDHYCDLLGTPIGERNHSLFWMFLVAQSILLVWGFSVVCSGFQGTILLGPTHWLGRNAMVIVNFILIGASMLGVVGMLIFQTWCALTDTLTYEFLKNTDLEYLAHFGPCDLPFSKGPCRNFYRFFVVQPGWCTSTKDWLPTKYAPPQQFFRDSKNCCLNPWENKYWRCC